MSRTLRGGGGVHRQIALNLISADLRIRHKSLDPKYRGLLRIAVLPYLHPRAFSRMTAKPSIMMTDQELQDARQAELEHERQVAAGRG